MFARKIRDCDVVLFFDAKDETMTSRLLKRALTSGRADDNYTTVKVTPPPPPPPPHPHPPPPPDANKAS